MTILNTVEEFAYGSPDVGDFVVSQLGKNRNGKVFTRISFGFRQAILAQLSSFPSFMVMQGRRIIDTRADSFVFQKPLQSISIRRFDDILMIDTRAVTENRRCPQWQATK